MSAAIMTMKRTTTAADLMNYSEALTAPTDGRSRSPPTIVRGQRTALKEPDAFPPH